MKLELDMVLVTVFVSTNFRGNSGLTVVVMTEKGD